MSGSHLHLHSYKAPVLEIVFQNSDKISSENSVKDSPESIVQLVCKRSTDVTYFLLSYCTQFIII